MFLNKLFKKKGGIILINGGTKQFSQDFLLACKNKNIDSFKLKSSRCILSVKDSHTQIIQDNKKVETGRYSNAFIRIKGKSPHMTALISRILSNKLIKINDKVNLSQTIEESESHIFNDEKITQMISLSQSNLSVPDTFIFSKISFELNKETIFKDINFPCVFKSSGNKGKAVWKVNNIKEIENIISDTKNELMMVQELLEIEYDVRALIFKDIYFGAIKRTSRDGFYTNVSKGGNAELIKLTSKEISLSKKACKAVGIDFGGVDFTRTPTGIKFFEVNKSPQITGFQSATGINIPEKIVQTIDSK